MPIRTVVIHAGPPKTGTTTIQSFMYRAREVLGREGIRYPDAGRIADGRTFRVRRPSGWMSKHGPAIAHHLLPWTLLDEVKGLDADECWDGLVAELRRAPESLAIVSSEAFSRLDRARVEAVRGYLRDFEVRVISYLRSPFSRMLSDYTQRVKSGRYHRSFSEFLAEERALLENYDGFLQYWDDTFGRGQVSIRDFERAEATGGLELDFSRCIAGDIDALRVFLAPARLNVSPDNGAVDRLRRINRLEAALRRPRILRRIFDGMRRCAGTRLSGRIARFAHSGRPLYQTDDRSDVEQYAGPRYAELAARTGVAGESDTGRLQKPRRSP